MGPDVRLRFIRYVVLDQEGDEIAGGRIDSNQEGLEELFALLGRRKAQFVREACSCFLCVCDAVSERVGADRVHVVQPHRVRRIANRVERNDPNHAWWLAYLYYAGRLPEAYVAEGEIRVLRTATRELRSAVDRRSDLIRRSAPTSIRRACASS